MCICRGTVLLKLRMPPEGSPPSLILCSLSVFFLYLNPHPFTNFFLFLRTFPFCPSLSLSPPFFHFSPSLSPSLPLSISLSIVIFFYRFHSLPPFFLSSTYPHPHAHTHTHTHSLLVRGCDFQYPASQIDLGSTLKKAVITGNIISVSGRSCSVVKINT